MKLITAEIAKRLPPIYTHDGKPASQVPVALKIFNPYGAGTWYITEGDPETGEAFGLCVIHEPELGYVSLHELADIRIGPGLTLERDRSWDAGGYTLLDAYKDAGHGIPEWVQEKEAAA